MRVNPFVENLEPYVPGEQPKGGQVVKLNTNENPYPPSPRVVEAIRNFDSEAVRKYPDPVCGALREELGKRYGIDPNRIIVGNGSDEILRMICHALAAAGDCIGMLDPTYSLYPILAKMFGLKVKRFEVDWRGAPTDELDLSDLAIFFLANPNPPYGSWYEPPWIAKLAERYPECWIVVDEAYVDFADGDASALLDRFPNVLISRTFSKWISLAGLRVGFALGSEFAIDKLNRIRDSYNVNALSQAAALAAIRDEAYVSECVAKIKATRERLTNELRERGFEVEPSAGNFIFARIDNAEELYNTLKFRGILVRYFNKPPLNRGVRITIGTDEQIDILLNELGKILR